MHNPSVACMNTVSVLKFQTIYSILLMPKFCLFLNIYVISGNAYNVDPDQTAP